ncbi:hypothetical protein [Streptomyces sp. cg35]|uniref:hypothetical protein n=1 Tax=Streptomyces sp. cg35 TaxID=3421650 RepID=UPI003D1802E7
MEQRMESQKVTPVTGAGFDPAYVPGLTSPRPETAVEDAVTESDEVAEEVTQSAPEKPVREKAVLDKNDEPEDEPEADSGPEAEDATAEAADADADSDSDSESASASASESASESGKGDGPAMEARDRRGSITVDATGVRYTLDDQEADFTWDEISAVEYGTSRKRLTVTVHTPNSRWYPNDVEAPDKARLAEWTEQIDKALDAYFED